jgi:hypothetical protein
LAITVASKPLFVAFGAKSRAFGVNFDANGQIFAMFAQFSAQNVQIGPRRLGRGR